MSTLQSADRYYLQQQQIAAVTVASAKKLWRRMDADFAGSWASVAPAMLQTVQLGRAAVAATSIAYTPAVLKETNQVAPAAGTISTAAFLSTAPDGRGMDSLLNESVIRAKVAVKGGASASAALSTAESWLTGMLLTVMADTGRGIVGADIAQRPALGGYVRMLNPPSCSRCAILAGKWFRWNQGFLRHPHCDCRHIPASESIAGDLTTDPYAYFNSLSKGDQDKMFRPHGVSAERAAQIGKSNARAIRDGGDIYRVENIRLRGLATAKGNLRYGTPSRMTVDDIYKVAGTRTNAIKLMEREGYITGPQVGGGNIIGIREGFGALGKGGKARAASDAVVESRLTGVRDPLNRYTMTAAERRLYDAKVRLDVGRSGVWPRSIGQNSTDIHVRPTAITPTELATLERAYRNEVGKLATAPESVRNLARLLGINI